MLFLKQYKNYFELSLLLIIIFNILLIISIPLSLFDQSINILLSIGIFEYFRNNKLKVKTKIKSIDIFLSLFILFFTLFRSYWLFSFDNQFIFLVLSLLLISLLIINYSFNNLFLNFRPILIALIFPIKEFLFIPFSMFLTPISTISTWFFLNIFGFDAYTKGQEIFIGQGGVDITFSCSGSEQIIFTISSMVVLNFLLPFRKKNIFYLQITLSILLTFLINIFRLCILAIFVHTYQSDKFSIFDFLHGSKGSLVFTLLSTLFSCEIYKKLYSLNKINY